MQGRERAPASVEATGLHGNADVLCGVDAADKERAEHGASGSQLRFESEIPEFPAGPGEQDMMRPVDQDEDIAVQKSKLDSQQPGHAEPLQAGEQIAEPRS